MSFKNRSIKNALWVCAASITLMACQKMERPKLGEFAKDASAPGGPLKFYVAFDGTTNNPLMNAVDSIRANFPSDNPLVSVDGVRGKAVQGTGSKAIKYPSANDFNQSTSATISLWVNNIVNPNTELYFSLVSKEYWHGSAAFLLVEHATPTAATLKFALQDKWVEYNNKSFDRPLFNGQWHHLAFVYDETNSSIKVYFDGAEVPLPPGAAGNYAGMGKLNLKAATNLVLAGWNKHAGLEGPTDAWINGFTGKMDQFRLYGKALTASEVLAIFNSKL